MSTLAKKASTLRVEVSAVTKKASSMRVAGVIVEANGRVGEGEGLRARPRG